MIRIIICIYIYIIFIISHTGNTLNFLYVFPAQFCLFMAYILTFFAFFAQSRSTWHASLALGFGVTKPLLQRVILSFWTWCTLIFWTWRTLIKLLYRLVVRCIAAWFRLWCAFTFMQVLVRVFYVCMHTCMHAYMHKCTHAYMHTCIHAYMHTCIHAYMHTCIHVAKPNRNT